MPGYDNIYGGYSTHALPTRNGEGIERNIPKYVQDKAEEFESKGYEVGYAFALAWSLYCKYKEPGASSCSREPSGYLMKKAAGRVAARYLRSQSR